MFIRRFIPPPTPPPPLPLPFVCSALLFLFVLPPFVPLSDLCEPFAPLAARPPLPLTPS